MKWQGRQDSNMPGRPITSPVVTVNDVAPSALAFSATPIDKNGTTTLSGVFSDPGHCDTFTLDTRSGRINWDDGSGDEVLAMRPRAAPNQSNGNTDTANHAYSTDLAPATYETAVSRKT